MACFYLLHQKKTEIICQNRWLNLSGSYKKTGSAAYQETIIRIVREYTNL